MIHPKYDWLIDSIWDEVYDDDWPSSPIKENIVLQLTIEGEPVSKQRALIVAGRNRKHHGYTPTKTLAAEGLIAQRAIEQIGLYPNKHSAFGVWIKFFTSDFYRRDIDNMTKLVFDALNKIVWNDDSQVIELIASVDRTSQLRPRTEIQCYTIPGALTAMVTIICENCGEEASTKYRYVHGKQSQRARYCSRDCFNAGRKKETFALKQARKILGLDSGT